MRTNKDIRILAIERGVYYWQIASKLGITPESFSRMLRRELDSDDKERVRQAIAEAAMEQQLHETAEEGETQ